MIRTRVSDHVVQALRTAQQSHPVHQTPACKFRHVRHVRQLQLISLNCAARVAASLAKVHGREPRLCEIVVVRVLPLIFLSVCAACEIAGNPDAGIPDAGLAGCPSEISVADVEEAASPNNDPAELLWSVKGYGMKVGPDQHDGISIAEQLVAIEDESVLSDDFVPVGVEKCPFAAGDAGRVFSCGSDESVFRVGDPGEVRYDGNVVVRFAATPNVFWDPFSIVADDSPLATVNEVLADNGMPPIERCRLGCIQTYHCQDKSQPPIGLFYRVEDYIWDQPIVAATDVETRMVDENGNSY